MEFERVVGNKKDYLPLLLLADEQEDMIDRYLGKGEMYLAKDPEVVGECVVCKVDEFIADAEQRHTLTRIREDLRRGEHQQVIVQKRNSQNLSR